MNYVLKVIECENFETIHVHSFAIGNASISPFVFFGSLIHDMFGSYYWMLIYIFGSCLACSTNFLLMENGNTMSTNLS